MGSSGLSTYLEENKEIFSKLLSKTGNPCRVVIDGSSFIFKTYHSLITRGFRNVLIYSQIERFVHKILDSLKAHNVEVVTFIYDAMSDVDKMKTYQFRRNEKKKYIKKAWNAYYQGKHHPTMILWFRYTLLNIIEKYYNGAVNMYVTGVDADRDVAKLASDSECAIISDDADMFVMSDYGVIRLTDCVHACNKEDEVLRLYHRQLFLDHFQVTYNNLVYLALIPGNDFVRVTSLRHALDIPEDEDQTIEHAVRYVTEYLKKDASFEDIKYDYYAHHPILLISQDNSFEMAFNKYMIDNHPAFPYSLFADTHNQHILRSHFEYGEDNTLENFLNTLDISISTKILDTIFSPVISYHMYFADPYHEQLAAKERIIVGRIRKLLGNGSIDPYVYCGEKVVEYYPNEKVFNKMLLHETTYINKHINVINSLRQLDIQERQQYLNSLIPGKVSCKKRLTRFAAPLFKIIEDCLKVVYPKKKAFFYLDLLVELQQRDKRLHIHKRHQNIKLDYTDEMFRDVVVLVDIIGFAYNIMSQIGNILDIQADKTLLDNFCIFCIMNEYSIQYPKKQAKSNTNDSAENVDAPV